MAFLQKTEQILLEIIPLSSIHRNQVRELIQLAFILKYPQGVVYEGANNCIPFEFYLYNNSLFSFEINRSLTDLAKRGFISLKDNTFTNNKKPYYKTIDLYLFKKALKKVSSASPTYIENVVSQFIKKHNPSVWKVSDLLTYHTKKKECFYPRRCQSCLKYLKRASLANQCAYCRNLYGIPYPSNVLLFGENTYPHDRSFVSLENITYEGEYFRGELIRLGLMTPFDLKKERIRFNEATQQEGLKKTNGFFLGKDFLRSLSIKI